MLDRVIHAFGRSALPWDQRVRETHFIRRADVQAVLDAFAQAAAAAPEVDDPGEEHRIIGAGSADRYGVIGIAKAVLAGAVKPIAVWRQGSGLRRFLFPRVIRLPGDRASTHSARQSSDTSI